MERRVNSVAGWCGTGGNAPLVLEEGGRGRRRAEGDRCRKRSDASASFQDCDAEAAASVRPSGFDVCSRLTVKCGI